MDIAAINREVVKSVAVIVERRARKGNWESVRSPRIKPRSKTENGNEPDEFSAGHEDLRY
jgi:hypothetical protein